MMTHSLDGDSSKSVTGYRHYVISDVLLLLLLLTCTADITSLQTTQSGNHFILYIDDIFAFLPERYTTLRSGGCRRNSVCLSSVCNVRAPYSAGSDFLQCFYTPFCTLTIGKPSRKNLRRSSQRNTPSAG